MNRINQLLQDRTKPVLSIYYPAGYPNLNDTTTILHTYNRKVLIW
jgi:tryptophan synthase alpha chain